MTSRRERRRSQPPGPARSRSWRPDPYALLAGLPALLAAGALVGGPLWAALRHPPWMRYEAKAFDHMNRNEFPEALVCLKRLLSIDPGHNAVTLALAQTYDQLGRKAQAESLVRSLAPRDLSGFAPARRWLALRSYRKPATETKPEPKARPEPKPTPEPAATTTKATATAAASSPAKTPASEKSLANLAEAVAPDRNDTAATFQRSLKDRPEAVKESEDQLLGWLREQPDAPDAKAMLGLLYAETGRHAEACRMLEPVAQGYPVLLLALAKSRTAMGDLPAAQRHLAEAREAARRVVKARPDDAPARHVWAMASMALGDYPNALNAYTESLPESSTATFRRERASVYASWANTLNRSGKAKLSDLLAVVQRGLSVDPSNEALLTDLSGLLTLGGPGVAEVRKAVDRMLDDRRTAAPARYALGMQAWSRGRIADARDQWERAYEADPHVPVLANNLASCLLASTPPDPARALIVIDRALVEAGDDPRFHATRGQVLGKLGRWRESAEELEHARSRGENGDDVRQALAEAYTHLGRTGSGTETGTGAARPADGKKGV